MPRPRLLAAGLLLLVTLPFLGRAHSIDDPLYLQAAQQARRAPLDPLGGASFWHERPATLFDDVYNPPLLAYLLAPLAGPGCETRVHLLEVSLAVLALLVAGALAERLGAPPQTALLLAASPALAVTSVSALADVPFLLLTLVTWHAAFSGRAGLSGAAGALGALTKYAGLLNLPLALLAAGRRGARGALAVLLPALALLGGWSALNLAQHGAVHLRAAARFQSLAPDRVALDAAYFVAALGLVGLPAALGLLRFTRAVTLGAAASGGLGAALVLARAGSLPTALLAAGAFAAGAALLVSAVAASRAAQGPLRVMAGAFWLYAAAAVLPVYFGAARYLLPLLPPLLCLLAAGGRLAPHASRVRWAASVGAGLCVSIGLLWGDLGFAEAWRRAALALPREVAGRRLAAGHWGFQHYAREAGYRPLDPREDLAAGDLVAEAQGIHGSPPSAAQRALLAPVEERRIPSPALRVMDAAAQAGFYSSAWGVLPFGLRRAAFERVTLGRVAGWVPGLLARPLETPVCVDLGSEDGDWTRLDGWSGPEAFDAGGERRSFVWSVGDEAALRLALPAGAERLRLAAHPSAEAVGPLAIALGSSARARVTLEPGWRSYDVPIEGHLAGGLTTIVLSPAGHHAPGLFERERRPLAVAVDWLAIGDGAVGRNQGAWAVRSRAAPGLAVQDTALMLTRAPGLRVRAGLRLSGPASLVWRSDAGESVLWRAPDAQPSADVDLVTPSAPGSLLLRAERALVERLELGTEP